MNASNPIISIIIVNRNGKKWLKDCLSSVEKQTFSDFEVIFVDNGSSDNSVEFVKKNYPEVTVILNHKNLGFGRANNLGASRCRGEVIFFLNNDTILEKDTLAKLLGFKRKKKLTIVGPKLLNANRKDVYQGRKITIDCTGYLGWGRKTFYVDGCSLMISKKDFFLLGGFDEKYFMYSEDIDLAWRAHLRGKKLALCKETSLVHFGGGTSETTQLTARGKHVVPLFRKYEVEKNNLRNILKNYSFPNALWVVPLFLFQSFLESVLYLMTGNWRVVRCLAKAILWNVVNFRDTLKERRRIQDRRIIPDREVFDKMSFGINKLKAFQIIGMPKFK